MYKVISLLLVTVAVAISLSSCATDNPRIFGGIKTEFSDSNQIVLSYDNAFEIGSILEKAYGLATEHCASFDKKSVMQSKDGSGDYTTVVFECKE